MTNQDDELQAMNALLSAHPKWGKQRVSIAAALRSRAVPVSLKHRYKRIMAAKYPTSRFGWEDK